jgi:transposase
MRILAATLLIVAGDNPERVQRETSFAALRGVSPVEASSGNTQRRRLNRGGDRQANAALHRIVVSRLRWDTRIQAYMQHRLADGRTRREVIRCLKRFVAREAFGLINSPDPVTATHPSPLDNHRASTPLHGLSQRVHAGAVLGSSL